MNKKMWAAPALDELDVSLTFGGHTSDYTEIGPCVTGMPVYGDKEDNIQYHGGCMGAAVNGKINCSYVGKS